MAKSNVTEDRLSTVNRLLGPTAKFGIGDNVIAEIEISSVVDGTPGIMDLTAQALEEFRNQPTHELFAHIRKTSVYEAEWDLLANLCEESPGQLRMARIALSTQFAVEACAVYPFLESDARRWLRHKFEDQGVPKFEAAWQDYLGIKEEVMLGDIRIYERVGVHIRVKVSDVSFPALA